MSNSLVTTSHINRALELITEGSSLRTIAKYLDLKLSTLYDAIQRDPLAAERYARALELQAEVEVDEIKEIADDENKDPKAVRNMMEARKWRASKRHQKRYGDKLDLTITENVDLSAARQRGRERAAERLRPMCDQSNIIDAEIVSKSIASSTRPTDTESVADVPDLDIFK